MSDRDFEIGARKFKLNKMDPFKQFHVARRMGPILGELVPLAGKLRQGIDENQYEALVPIINGISKLSDNDATMVLTTLLSCVEVQNPGVLGWARVAVDGQLMFQDLDLPILLQIASRAFAYNLKGFFGGLPQASA